MAGRNINIVHSYRARLVHLEADETPVLDDLGQPITEDIPVTLSWPLRVARTTSARSVATRRAVATRAVQKANRGMAVQRRFMVTDIEHLGSRKAPQG